MNKLKKSVSAMLLIIFSLNAVSVSAANTDGVYATREYTISEFIQSVGRNNFTNTTDLTKYVDGNYVSAEYASDVALAVGGGILTGYDDNTLRMKVDIKRVEAMAILSRCLPTLDTNGSEIVFEDTPQWAQADIARLTKAGILKGYGDGTFGADDKLTKQQVKMLTDRIDAIMNPVRLEDDFYQYMTGKISRNYKPYDGYNAWGYMAEVGKRNNDKLYKLIGGYAENVDQYSPKSAEAKLGETYLLVNDMDTRNEAGLSPFDDVFANIDAAKNLNEFTQSMIYTYENTGCDPFFGLSVFEDMKSNDEYRLYVNGPSIAISKEEWKDSGSAAKVKAYKNYVSVIVNEIGGQDAKAYADKIVDFEKEIADKYYDEDKMYINKLYNVYTQEKVEKLLSNANISTVFNEFGIKSDTIIVPLPNLLKLLNTYYTEDNLDFLKEYAKFCIVRSYGSYADEATSQAVERYYSAANGINSTIGTDDLNMEIIENVFPYITSRVFVENFCNASDKKAVEGMVDEVLDTFEKRLQDNTWLSAETKKNAIDKLEAMNVQVGYPDDMSSVYDSYVVKSAEEGGTLLDLAIDSNVISLDGMFLYVDEAVDKDAWNAYPTMANASYTPGYNCISIPAAILQAPYYSSEYSDEENWGGIGFIIGHEITHAFDNTGSYYDKRGAIKNWWTEKDYKQFDSMSKSIMEYYSEIEAVPGHYVDGEKTLGENIADLGGMSCAIEIVKNKGGDLKKLFENYAITWASNETNSYIIKNIEEDVHAPKAVRVNAVLSTFDEFYEAYGIDENDGMYVPEEDRVSLW